MNVPKQPSSRMNSAYIRNALRSITKITVESVTDYAPETRSVVKNSSIASAAKGIKADPTIKGQFNRATKKLMGEKEDVDAFKVEQPAGTDYKLDIKKLRAEIPDPEPFNVSHVKSNYYVKDINYKSYSKAIYRTIAAIGQSNQSSLCRIEHKLNLIIQDLDNDLLFFGNTMSNVTQMSANIASSLSSFSRYVNIKTGVGSSRLTTDAVLSYIRAEKMFSVAEVVKAFKNSGNKDADVIGVWLSNTFTDKAATMLTFMTNNFAPKNIRNLGDNIKSTILNINTIVSYTLKDMAESDNPLFVMLADRLGFKSEKSKVYYYKKGKVDFDGITKRAIVRTIPTLLSKILTAIDREHYPNELTYDYQKGVFTNEEDVRKLRRKYKKVNQDYKGTKNLKEYKKQTSAYNKYANRFSSSDKVGKDDFSIYEDDKYRKYRQNRYMKHNTGMKMNIGLKITGKLEEKLLKLDNWLFSLPTDAKSLELIMHRGLGMGESILKENGKIDFSSALGIIRSYMRYRIPEKAREVIGKVFHIQLQPLDFYMEKVKNKVTTTLKLDYMKELYSTAKVKVKDFIMGPVTDLIVNAKLSIASFITTSLMRFTRFLDNQTKFLNNVLANEGIRRVRDGMEDEVSSRVSKKREVATTFKRSEKAITTIHDRLKTTVLGPIREQYKIYSGGGVLGQLNAIDSYVANILYKNGIEPSMTPHNSYDMSFKDKLKKWLFRPLKHILGYFKDVVKEMHLLRGIKKIPKLIGKVIKTAFKTVDHAVSVVTGFLKTVNPILKVVGQTIKTGAAKIADIHKTIMSHTKDVVHLLFTDIAPAIIEGAGKIAVTLIKTGAGAAKFAATSFLKLSGTAIAGGLNAVKGLIKGAGNLILALDSIRKHLFIKNGETYEGNLVGGKLDGIYSSVAYYEVKTVKDKFKEEDDEDKADDNKVKKLTNKIRGVIGDRVKTMRGRMDKLLFGALGFGIEMMSKMLTTTAGFALGGFAGSLIGKVADKIWGTKLGQKFKALIGKKKDANVMNVYIVGGSVDGNAGLLDSLANGKDKNDAGDVVEDVIEDVADSSNGKKSILRRGLDFAKRHKKGLGIAAAVTTTAVAVKSYQSYKKSEEVKALEEISNEVGTPEKSNRIIDQGNADIQRLQSVPATLKAATNDKSVNDSEAFDLTKGKGKINNRALKGISLFNNEVATTENKTETVDKLVANKRSQIKVDDRNEKVLYGKLTEEEKLERLSQQGVLGVIGQVDKPQSVGKLNDNKSSFRGILENWKYGFARGGMLGGAFCALGAKHILGNKKLMAAGLGMSEEEFSKYLSDIAKNTKNNNNNNQNGQDDANANGAGTNSTSGFIWPVPGHTRISSPFGWRMHPVDHVRKHHNGIDISAPSGATIVAARAGTVVDASSHGGYGNFTQIQHDDGNMTCYAHQSKFAVKKGDVVSQGQKIGEVGSTGKSTGPHLHFEVRTKEPYSTAECEDPQKFVSPNNDVANSTANPNDSSNNNESKSYITPNNAFTLNFDKIKLQTVPEDGSNEYPDPNYVDKAKRKLMTQSSGPAVHDEGDANASSEPTPSKPKPVSTSTASLPTPKYDYIPPEDSGVSCESSVFDDTYGTSLLSLLAGTMSVKKIHNTSGSLGVLLNNEEDNTLKGQVYATLVALLQELNDESARLKDSANIAIITEVKQQLEVIDSKNDITVDDIAIINNSILQIAAGY